MKSTEPLIVITDFKIKDKIIIHPNDGFDLDLYNNKYIKKIFVMPKDDIPENNSNFIECEIILANECKNGTVQMSNVFWQKIGKPKKVKLSLNDDKIYISSALN